MALYAATRLAAALAHLRPDGAAAVTAGWRAMGHDRQEDGGWPAYDMPG